MSGTALKIIALILMTADHIGDIVPDMPLWLRWIGRISSPLFFFCAAEGAVHTSDRCRYLKRLWQASAAMAMLEAVLPAVLSMYFRITLYDFDNNIFLSIFHGVLIISILESTKNDSRKRTKYLLCYGGYQFILAVLSYTVEVNDPIMAAGIDINLIPILRDWDSIVFTLLGSLWHSEGPAVLTASIVLFYFCRENKKRLAVWYSTYCALYFLIFVPQIGIHFFNFLQRCGLPSKLVYLLALPINALGIPTMRIDTARNFTDSLLRINFQWMMIFALPFMLMYNGKKGKGLGRLFYIYYPVHLVIIHIISAII